VINRIVRAPLRDQSTRAWNLSPFVADCLAKLELVGPADLLAVGCKVFPRYLATARALQRTYMLEPAGSHGVWSLDDYQFLAFVFGSSQLVGHAHIKPKSVHSEEVREGYAKDYIYLSSIDFIYSVKQGAPFSEHSPVLYDISQLPSWAKVNDGLLKMYKGEVLSKLPVMQHLVFGTLFPASWEPSREPVPSETTAHALVTIVGTGSTKEEAAALERVSKVESVPIDEPLMAVAPWVKSPPNVIPNPASNASAVGEAAAAGSPGSSGSSASSAGGGRERAGSGMVAMLESFGGSAAFPPTAPSVVPAAANPNPGSSDDGK
jgi:Phosphotyrosyl phosphate activator (PTPA) protein